MQFSPEKITYLIKNRYGTYTFYLRSKLGGCSTKLILSKLCHLKNTKNSYLLKDLQLQHFLVFCQLDFLRAFFLSSQHSNPRFKRYT